MPKQVKLNSNLGLQAGLGPLQEPSTFGNVHGLPTQELVEASHSLSSLAEASAYISLPRKQLYELPFGHRQRCPLQLQHLGRRDRIGVEHEKGGPLAGYGFEAKHELRFPQLL